VLVRAMQGQQVKVYGSHQSSQRVDVDVAAGVEDEKIQGGLVGVPQGEQQHCALGHQQGQLGEPHRGPSGGQLGGRAHEQMAGPLHVGLRGQQNVLERVQPLCELSERSHGLGGQLVELRELSDELREQVGELVGGQGGQGHCDAPELGGLQLVGHLLDGGHCGDVRQGEGQGRVT